MFGYSFRTPSQYDTIAAIDLGSNSFHLIVARVVEGEFQVIDRVKKMVRLASGLDKDKYLTEEAQEKALTSLELFSQRIRDLPQGAVRAVGTNTLRAARNGDAFRKRAERVLGHPIDVIAGREEARLIYLAVARTFPGQEENRLVVDIGGGSTEVILGEGMRTLRRESVHMGCVSYTVRYFANGEISDACFQRAIGAAWSELNPYHKAFRKQGWRQVIGCSGTIKAIASIIKEQFGGEEDESGDRISLEGLYQIRDACTKAGHIDKLKLKGLSNARRPVLVGGVAVLIGIFEALKIEVMQASQQALREGLLYDLMGRIYHEDARGRSVLALAKRFSIDVEHANGVAALAVDLLQQVRDAWDMQGPEYDEWLEWAALLHELGMAVSHTQYQKHGAYLIENADISGFSQQEKRILAVLVRSHRRKWPIQMFEEWDAPEAVALIHLSILLRLAVLLRRDRSRERVEGLRVEASKMKLRLRFPPGWLDENPLTALDLETEANYLASAGYKLKVV